MPSYTDLKLESHVLEMARDGATPLHDQAGQMLMMKISDLEVQVL